MNPKSGQKEGTVDDKSWEFNVKDAAPAGPASVAVGDAAEGAAGQLRSKSAQNEGTVDDKSWELNIRERFRKIEEENSKLPQNLEPSENKTLLDLCEKIKLFSNGYVKHKIHELDKYVWDYVQKFEAVQRELEQIAENEKLHCENFRKVFPWTKPRYTLNHQIAHAMVRSLCHLHPMNLSKLILHFALPEERTTSDDSEHLMAQKKFLGGILAAEAQNYLPLMNDWDARYHIYIQNNPVLLGNMCIGLMALNTTCCLIPFRNDWRATTAFFEQKSGPFYRFLNEDLQLSIVQSNNPRQNKNPRQNNNPRLSEITVQNSLAHLRLLDDIDFHYLIVCAWDPNVDDPAREYIWKHKEKSPEKTSFTQHVMQAVQKAKKQGSCKFWEEILLRTPQSLNYRRSLYVEHDPVYTPEIDTPSEVWLTCYVCNELIGIAQALPAWEGLVVTNNPTEQDLAQPRETALSPKLGKLDAQMSFLYDYLFKDNSGTSGITNPILRANTAYNPYIVDFNTSNPYYVNLETSTGHLSYIINIKTSGNMDNLDFENDKENLLQVLKILAPGIVSPTKYIKLLNFVKLAVDTAIDNTCDWETKDFESEELETRQYTMITFLENLSAFQNDQIQKTINYFWRIFDAKIYDNAIQKLNCPKIQGLLSSSFDIYSVFFDLCSLCSWNDKITESVLRNFRILVLQLNWDSNLVRNNIYGHQEERFVKFFTDFVEKFLKMPTDTSDKIDEFKKKCEKHNHEIFVRYHELFPNEQTYYNQKQKFWSGDNKDEINAIESIPIPETTEMIDDDAKEHGNLILIKWEKLATDKQSLTQNKISRIILKEINLMKEPLEKRNALIKTRIENRKATAEKLAIREQKAAEKLAIREQEAAEELTYTAAMTNRKGRNGTRIAKSKTAEEKKVDAKIFQHASEVYWELYHQDLDEDLLPDFFKMRKENMTEIDQQTRIRNILEHHKTYAKEKEVVEGTYTTEVQRIWEITDPVNFKRDVGRMTADLPIIERILPPKDGIRSLDDLAKSIIKEYMKIELQDGTPLEGKTIDKTFKLALIIDKARAFAEFSTNTLARIHKSNLDSKHILSALETRPERYEEMLSKLKEPGGHRGDIEKWVQDLEINEDTGSFWKNIFDNAKTRNFDANRAVMWFLKQKTSAANRRTQAQALAYLDGLDRSNGEEIKPWIDVTDPDFKYARYEAIPGFPKRNTSAGKKLYYRFDVEALKAYMVHLGWIDPNTRIIPRKYQKLLVQLAMHKRQEHEVWLKKQQDTSDWAARFATMSGINSQPPVIQTKADSDVEVKRSADFNGHTTENDPSLEESARDPSLPAKEMDPGLLAPDVKLNQDNLSLKNWELRNSPIHKPTPRHPSMPWKCYCCNRLFQTWMYIPPEASEEQVVVVPALPMEQVVVVPALPMEQVDVVPKIIIPPGKLGLRDHIKYTPDSGHMKEMNIIVHYEKMTREAEERSVHSDDNSWQVKDFAETYTQTLSKKEMDDLYNEDPEDKEGGWKIHDTLGTVEKYTYQSIDKTVPPRIGIRHDPFWEKTFFYYNYLENMKLSRYGRQSGVASTEATIFDRTIHERVGQKFAIKIFETTAETEQRERIEGMQNKSTLSNEEELINQKNGQRENNRTPGTALAKKTKQQKTWEKSAGNLGGQDKDDHDRFIRDEIDRDKEKHGNSDDEYDNDENGPGYIKIGGQRYNFG